MTCSANDTIHYYTNMTSYDKNFKKSLYEMYEDIQDIKFLESYIDNSADKKREFIKGDDLFKE